MDYRELNQYVDTYTVNADVCAQKLRERQTSLCQICARPVYEFMWTNLCDPFKKQKSKGKGIALPIWAQCHTVDHVVNH